MTVDVYNRRGKRSQASWNKVTTTGLHVLTNLLCGAGPGLSHIALGTHDTEAGNDDLALGDEKFRNALTRMSFEPSKLVCQILVSTAQANGYTYSEVGLFADNPEAWTDSAAGLVAGSGSLFARATIDPIEKTVADTMIITWEIPIRSVTA